jgi:hypothetical protein
MKKTISLILGAALILTTTAAFALPPIPDYAAEHYAKQPHGEKIVEAMKLKAAMGKCSMCHIPDADKKAKGHGLNDFGKAVHDNFKHKDFTAEDKASKADGATDEAKAAAKAKAMAILVDALSKASAMKNKDGKVYGDLIKAGTLPGDNSKKPEEAKK